MKPTRILLLALLIVLALPVAAHASCAVQLPLSESLAASSVVFTGTVVSVAGGDRIATVLVDEVWKGGTLPEQVEVRGGPGHPESITSVDRSFVKGDKYLFVRSTRRPRSRTTPAPPPGSTRRSSRMPARWTHRGATGRRPTPPATMFPAPPLTRDPARQ